jgi:hypothetical protein
MALVGLAFAYNNATPMYTDTSGVVMWGNGPSTSSIGDTIVNDISTIGTGLVTWAGYTNQLSTQNTPYTAYINTTISNVYKYGTIWLGRQSIDNPADYYLDITFPFDFTLLNDGTTYLPPGYSLTKTGQKLTIEFKAVTSSPYITQWSLYYLPYIFINCTGSSVIPTGPSGTFTFAPHTGYASFGLNGMYFQTANPYGGYFNYDIQYLSPSTVLPETISSYPYAYAIGGPPGFYPNDISIGAAIYSYGTSPTGGHLTAYSTNPSNKYAWIDGTFRSVSNIYTVYKIFTCVTTSLTTETAAAFSVYRTTSTIIPDYITSVTVNGVYSALPPAPWYITYNGTFQGQIIMYAATDTLGSITLLPAVMMRSNTGGATILQVASDARILYPSVQPLGIQQVNVGNTDPSACIGPDVYLLVNDVWERIDTLSGMVNVQAVDPAGNAVIVPAHIIRSSRPSTFLEAYFIPGIGYFSQHHCLFERVKKEEEGTWAAHCNACAPFAISGYKSSVMRHSDWRCTMLPYSYWYHVAPVSSEFVNHCIQLQGGYLSEFYRTNLVDADVDEWIVM